jgi:hypothetical protein
VDTIASALAVGRRAWLEADPQQSATGSAAICVCLSAAAVAASRATAAPAGEARRSLPLRKHLSAALPNMTDEGWQPNERELRSRWICLRPLLDQIAGAMLRFVSYRALTPDGLM